MKKIVLIATVIFVLGAGGYFLYNHLKPQAGLVTCCTNSSCTRVSRKNCEYAGGRVVNADSCSPNPCKGETTNHETPRHE